MGEIKILSNILLGNVKHINHMAPSGLIRSMEVLLQVTVSLQRMIASCS